MIEISEGRKFDHLPVRPKTKRKQVFLVFDTESRLSKCKGGITKHTPFLICYQVLTLHYNGKSNQTRIAAAKSVKEFYKAVDRVVSEHRYITLIAHNSNYDIAVTDFFEYLHSRNYSCQTYNPARNAFYIRFVKDGSSITIIDNMNFFSGKLAALGEDLEMPKLEMPKSAELSKEFIAYCKRDVEIVTNGLKLLSKICAKWELGALAITRAKLCMLVYQANFLDAFVQIHNHKPILELEFAAYYGGRTEALYQGTHNKGMKYYVDFNSLYPSVMKSTKYSTHYRFQFGEIDSRELVKYERRYNICANVDLNTTEPAYPLRTGDSIIFPTGQFNTTLANEELDHALTYDRVTKVHYGACYHRKEIFTDFVDYFHRLKTRYKSEGKPLLTYFSKLMLNSLYGKFGQRVPLLEATDEMADERYGIIHVRDYKEKRAYRKKIINYKVYKETERQVSAFSVPIIASEITSKARMQLWRAIVRAGYSNVFYMDTDSLIVNQEGYDNLAGFIQQNRIGYLELENQSADLTINALKDYKFGEQTRLKGVPNKARQTGADTFDFEHFSTLSEYLSQQTSEPYVSEIRTKQVRRQIKKGVKQPNGFVLPWRLGQP